MNTLTPRDLPLVVSRLPKDLLDILKNSGLIVAGGFIRETIAGGQVNDIDVFGADVETLRMAANKLAFGRKDSRKFESPNAITILSTPRLPVQFIKRWVFPDPQACVASFDFTVCQAAVWWRSGGWHSAVHSDFYPDLAARRLVYTFPVRDEEPGGSMLRMRKFLQRGYGIQAEAMAGVISRLTKDIPAHLNERDCASAVSKLLREVDPLTIVDGVDVIDEHQVAKS